MESPDEDEGGEGGEGSLGDGDEVPGEEVAEFVEGMLGEPEERDGAEAEGEGELGALHGGTGGEAGGEHEVERSAGEEGGEETEGEASFGRGETAGFFAEAGGDVLEEPGGGDFLMEIEGDEEEGDDEDPGEDEGGGFKNPAEGLLAEDAAEGADEGVGNEAAAVVGSGREEAA